MSERAQLEALVSRQEASVRRAFVTFLRDVRSDAVMREVRTLLSGGNLSAALDIVDSHVISMSNVIPQVFTQSANSSVAGMSNSVARSLGRAGARVAIGFDPTDSNAASMMKTARLNFIREFSREQRAATRSALVSGMQSGSSIQEMARDFRDSIGLTRAQLASVENYRRLLETQSREALQRVLRDRRFDSSVESAIESGEPLSASQIDRMVERYQARFLAYRAENIARTETQSIANQARQEALRQAIDQSGFDPDNVVRVWNATKDKRTRDTHREMDGQERGINEMFDSPSGARLMFPGDPRAPAEERIHCRCVMTFEIRSTVGKVLHGHRANFVAALCDAAAMATCH